MPSSIKLTEPLDILVEYGYLDDNTPYHKALNIAVNDFSEDETLGGEYNRDYIEILQKEVKKELKLRRKTINISKFLGKNENKTDAITQKKSPPNGSTGDIGGSLQQIAIGVNSIVDTLKEDYKQDENFDKFKQRQEEKKRRKSKENKLEAKKFDGIKKTATKLLKPFKSAWNRVFDFLKTVFFGRILFKLMNWISDPQNQKKLQSILRFVKDWWPVLLTAYLLFGNAFGRMAVRLTVMISKFAVSLITTIIPKLVAGLAKMKAGRLLNMIPGGGIKGKLLSSTLLLGGGMLMGNAMSGGDDVGDDTAADLDTMQFEGQFNGGGLVNNYNQFIRNYNGGGLIQGFKDGALVQQAPTPADFGLPADFDYDNPKHRELLVDVLSPHMKKFVQDQNAMVDENPEAFQGIKLKMDRDGRMPNFGEFIANMSEEAFNSSVASLESNPSMQQIPEAQGAILAMMTDIRRQTLDNPNFKGDVAFDINKDIPGTAAYRLLMAAQQDTTSPAAKSGAFTADQLARQANRQNMVTGGFVSGPGGIDQVPARLTAGEFVMSKGAVQKYGANTLAAMNAAGGGTNRPTMGRYNEGGLVQPIVEAGSINSYEDAIKAGVKIEDIVAGGMRFGSIKWTEKMPRGLFGLGKQKYQTKGTKWNVSGTGGGADEELAMSTKDYVNKKMGWTTGAAANVSGSETNKSSNTGILGPISSNVDSMVNSAGFTPVAKKDMDLNPVSKNNVLLDYQKEGGQLDSDMQKAEIQTVSSKEVPDFDPKAMRSAAKIQVLGISL